MPSEHRLHPVSLLFALWGSAKTLALPAALFIFSSFGWSRDESTGNGGPSGWVEQWLGVGDLAGWQIWAMAFAGLAMLTAVLQYLTFRITYEGSELVIRSGFFFRNERHVPYDRIQNLDATRRILHRLFSVAEVRVETGGGVEPEARISVLHETAFEEMRRRVFAGRSVSPPSEQPGEAHAASAASAGSGPASTAASTLLHLPTRELVLLGAVENRGMLVLAAAYGLLWELGWQDALWTRLTGSTYAVGALSDIWTRLSAGQLPALWELGVMAVGLIALFVLMRLLSMIWVSVTLHDFRLTRIGDDLRTEYGLLTRVSATVPRRRIQTVTIRATPLQRWLGRSSVRVETAGAAAVPQNGQGFQRERLAPIIRASAVGDLIRSVMPVCDPDQFEWQRVHTRAFRRAVKPMLLLSGIPSVLVLVLVDWRLWPVMLIAMAATAVVTRMQVQHFAWAIASDTVAIRSGWLWRRVSIAPLARIQAVSTTESPFDRRAGMAAVAVDTAGSPLLRVRIPYLAREVARDLSNQLSVAAAQTRFRW
jgi:putative membrane protein